MAARIMVTIQKRMVIFDSCTAPLGFLKRYLISGSSLFLLGAERVVQRRPLEHALLHSAARAELWRTTLALSR